MLNQKTTPKTIATTATVTTATVTIKLIQSDSTTLPVATLCTKSCANPSWEVGVPPVVGVGPIPLAVCCHHHHHHSHYFRGKKYPGFPFRTFIDSSKSRMWRGIPRENFWPWHIIIIISSIRVDPVEELGWWCQFTIGSRSPRPISTNEGSNSDNW